MGRLYQDSEMAAITTGGLGIMGLYKKMLWILVPLVFVLFGLALFVNAWATKQRDIYWKEAERRCIVEIVRCELLHRPHRVLPDGRQVPS